MKKLTLTTTILLGLAIGAAAQSGGGLFQRGEMAENTDMASTNRDVLMPVLPNHGQSSNQNAPLGGGTALLFGLGVMYMTAKKHKED